MGRRRRRRRKVYSKLERHEGDETGGKARRKVFI